MKHDANKRVQCIVFSANQTREETKIVHQYRAKRGSSVCKLPKHLCTIFKSTMLHLLLFGAYKLNHKKTIINI
uniref:Uncharacterized protein n=1 Tax=Arundo donax TaxID=35708 RepID=A0A0A8XRD3_ARUDO